MYGRKLPSRVASGAIVRVERGGNEAEIKRIRAG